MPPSACSLRIYCTTMDHKGSTNRGWATACQVRLRSQQRPPPAGASAGQPHRPRPRTLPRRDIDLAESFKVRMKNVTRREFKKLVQTHKVEKPRTDLRKNNSRVDNPRQPATTLILLCVHVHVCVCMCVRLWVCVYVHACVCEETYMHSFFKENCKSRLGTSEVEDFSLQRQTATSLLPIIHAGRTESA